jgi:ABC-2 type transport system ATP-binding protein
MSTPVLRIENVTKVYGSLVAVRNLSLEVFDGEIFGLLGPNGAGKTTSINILCGLLKPDTGRVLIHGRSITDGDADLRTRVGVCPQNIVLWGTLTCLEQLVFVGEMYGLRGPEARRRAERLLGDLDLAHDPEILILDEPEAGLDPQSRVMVREYVRSLARRKTVILTTHNMDEADRMADRVAILDHGQLLTVDTPEALKRTVGQGDVLEIELNTGAIEPALAALASIMPEVSATNHTLVIRARGVVEMLPSVLETLRKVDAHPGEVRLRANTLEDVFISLTGRRLRE